MTGEDKFVAMLLLIGPPPPVPCRYPDAEWRAWWAAVREYEGEAGPSTNPFSDAVQFYYWCKGQQGG